VAGHPRGGSGSPVQVELSQAALMLRVLRDRSQAGRLGLDGDPVYGQRPVRGAARAEQGVGGCRVVAGFGFPAAEEPDRVIAVAGPAGPARYFPAGSPRPGRTRPGTGLPVPRCPMCPQRPCSRSATRRPRPAIGAHLRSPSWRCTPVHAPMLGLPGQTGLPVPGALHDALLLGSGEPSTGPAPWAWSHQRRPCPRGTRPARTRRRCCCLPP